MGDATKAGADDRCGKSRRKEILIAALGVLAGHFGYERAA